MKIRSRFFIVKYYNRDTNSRLHLSVAAVALITLIIFIFRPVTQNAKRMHSSFSPSDPNISGAVVVTGLHRGCFSVAM